MSNLSDLLPAGAGAKVITATADGNLATGQTVALQSNGTVSQVAESSPTFGSANIFDTDTVYNIATLYDPVNDRVIAFYDDGTSNEGYYSVGVVSGTSITWGTLRSWYGARPNSISPVFDTANSRIVMVYRNNSGYPVAKVGYISNLGGGVVTFGSETTIDSYNARQPVACYDPDTGKVIVTYGDTNNSTYGTSRVGTVSGESISFGSEVVFNSSATYPNGAVYHTGIDRTIFTYNDTGSSQIKAVVASISGTTPSFSGNASFHSGNNTLYATNNFNQLAYDTTANRVVFTARDGNGQFAYAGEAATSGVTWGSKATIKATAGSYSSIAFNVSAGVTTVFYTDVSPNMYGLANDLTISGSTITPSGTNTSYSDFSLNRVYAIYDPDSTKSIVVFTDGSNNTDGQSKTYSPGSTNSSDFAGITNQAINNSASGEVVVEGGVITNASLLPFAYTGTTGSSAVFESATSNSFGICFDSSNNKVVVTYDDEGNSSYGTAVVGTVSGTSISWGTPVVFNSSSVNGSNCWTAFDSNVNKTVTIFRDNGNSEYGTAIVGTVSGTSISFGTKAVYNSASAYATASDICFDSTQNKLLICYRDVGNNHYGTAIVGTISGTSISFGTEVVFDSTQVEMIGCVHDPSTGKNVVANKEGSGNNGVAQVATISGTSVSFGSQATFNSTGTYYINAVYDSNSNKVVLCYENDGGGNLGQAKVCTISGTSISFGTAATFSADGETVVWVSAGFDSNQNRIVVASTDTSNTTSRFNSGAVSGTDITFGTSQTYLSGNAYPLGQRIVFDTSQNTNVWVYKDNSNSQYGTGIAMQLSGANPTLTVGSTYYVQSDGTLSTTSSSVTAGKAIANTTLLLKG